MLWHKVPDCEVCHMKMSFYCCDTRPPIWKLAYWKCPFIVVTHGPQFRSLPYENVFLLLWPKVPNLEVCLMKMYIYCCDTRSQIWNFASWKCPFVAETQDPHFGSLWKCPFIAAAAQICASHCFHAVVASIWGVRLAGAHAWRVPCFPVLPCCCGIHI